MSELGDDVSNYCCEDLETVLATGGEDAAVFEHESGLILLNAGRIEQDGEEGALLLTVQFCPFCGTELQSDDDIDAALEAVN
ncbi:MAG: hypothetical protein J0I28_11270 [Caulobacterales bacterium]|nr:hypothetical protein [Caulobacterales bacterium]